jgi:hypothetical protein
MGKREYRPNPRVIQVMDELDNFREFCCDFGYRFREEDLFNFKSYAWQQYNKFTQGKNAKNMWVEDARRLGRNV